MSIYHDQPIYLDNSATTRPSPEVVAVMRHLFEENYGNPSSLHAMGFQAEREVKNARQAVARALSVLPAEIIFTSGGTEAINQALFGAARIGRKRGRRIITSPAEHPAVLESCRRLADEGYEIVYLPVDPYGVISLRDLEAAIDDSTILINLMMVNNELGTIGPISQVGRIKQKAVSQRADDLLFHSDAVQAFGKIPLEPKAWSIDLLSLSGHKIHGPKGSGALFIKRGVALPPLIYGGGQEAGRRSGTENSPAIAGLGIASDDLQEKIYKRLRHFSRLRQYLMENIKNEIADVRINSPEQVWSESDIESRPGLPVASPAILNVSFAGCRGEVLLRSLEQSKIYVSTGSACSSRQTGSHVLKAIGLPREFRQATLRFSFSEDNCLAEMERVVEALKASVAAQRKLTKR
ncbi:MAG TPA: cysteine desulfurase [Clostridiales bacterium]|jgi:cysteine desulfurase|nr:cysteine desulfurase [Clostridiales bacterium]